MTTQSTYIGYEGNVTFNIKWNNKIIRSCVKHNTGALPLFKFICLCLGGNYKTAEPSRPFKIKLFGKNMVDETEIPASGFISINTQPIVEDSSEENSQKSQYKITYHFLIPYTQIYNTVSKITRFRLYGVSETIDENYSAEFIVPEDNEIISANPSSTENMILIIDWELKVSDFNN